MSMRHVLADEQIVAELTGWGVAVLIVSALGSPRHVRRMLHTGVAGVVARATAWTTSETPRPPRWPARNAWS